MQELTGSGVADWDGCGLTSTIAPRRRRNAGVALLQVAFVSVLAALVFAVWAVIGLGMVSSPD